MKCKRLPLILAGLLLMISDSVYCQNVPRRPSERSIGDLFGPTSPDTNVTSLERQIPEKSLESLVSTNANERFNAILALKDERIQLVTKLMGIVNGDYSVRQKVYAVSVLGEFRVAEAAPILVHHFEWDQEGGVIRLTNRGPYRQEHDEMGEPVGNALVKIGLPAIPPLLGRVLETDDTGTIDACMGICRVIEGWDVTQFRLEQSLKNAKDQATTNRIQSALQVVKIGKALDSRTAGIPILLDIIEETDDLKRIERCLVDCQLIEKWEGTQSSLQARLEKASDQKKKERLQSAIEIVKKRSGPATIITTQ
jgi:hypothetical protein